MSTYITNNKVVLQADGLGYQAAKYQLTPAPSGTNTMVFAYRAYANNITQSERIQHGFDPTFCFGLSFDGSFPSFNYNANFFGICAPNAFGGQVYGSPITPANQTSLNYANSGMTWNNGDMYTFWQQNSGYNNQDVPVILFKRGDGQYGNYGDDVVFYYGTSASNTSQNWGGTQWTGGPNNYPGASPASLCFPAASAYGTAFTGFFIIQKDATTATNIVYSVGVNMNNVPLNSLATAVIDPLTHYSGTPNTGFNQSVISETTNFRDLSGGMHFPQYVVVKWPSGIPGTQFIIEGFQVLYSSETTPITSIPVLP